MSEPTTYYLSKPKRIKEIIMDNEVEEFVELQVVMDLSNSLTVIAKDKRKSQQKKQ